MTGEKLSSEEMLKQHRLQCEFLLPYDSVFSENEVKKIIKRVKEEEREKLYKIVEESFNDFDEINRGGINMILRHLKEEFEL